MKLCEIKTWSDRKGELTVQAWDIDNFLVEIWWGNVITMIFNYFYFLWSFGVVVAANWPDGFGSFLVNSSMY
jgi:hypothetical protein